MTNRTEDKAQNETKDTSSDNKSNTAVPSNWKRYGPLERHSTRGEWRWTRGGLAVVSAVFVVIYIVFTICLCHTPSVRLYEVEQSEPPATSAPIECPFPEGYRNPVTCDWNPKAGVIEIKGCRFSERETPSAPGAPILRIEIKDSCFMAGLELGGVDAAKIAIERSILKDGPALESGEIEPALALERTRSRKVELNESSFGWASIENLLVEGVLETEHSRFERLEIAHSRFHGIEARDLAIVRRHETQEFELILRNVEASQIELEHARLFRFDFTAVRAPAAVWLTGASWEKGVFNNVVTHEFKVKNAKGTGLDGRARLNLISSSVDVFDITNARADQVLWRGGAVKRLVHDQGDEAVVATLRAQSPLAAAEAFDVVEKGKREDGHAYDANRIRLQKLAHLAIGKRTAEGDENSDEETVSGAERALACARLAYLDGVGHPLAYLALLVGLVMWGARHFQPNPLTKEPPDYPSQVVPVDPKPKSKQWEATETGTARSWTIKEVDHNREVAAVVRRRRRRPAHGSARRQKMPDAPNAPPPDGLAYSPVVMSLATLLPGDVFNYLRNFKFVPKSHRDAWKVTMLQIVALFVQGLLVFSVASLLGR